MAHTSTSGWFSKTSFFPQIYRKTKKINHLLSGCRSFQCFIFDFCHSFSSVPLRRKGYIVPTRWGVRRISIYIYIHSAGLQEGPKTIKITAAKEPAKSCEGARSKSRRPKRYKNMGEQFLPNVFLFAPLEALFWPKTAQEVFFRSAWGSLAALGFCCFFGFGRAGRRAENCENVSFWRISRLVVFWGRLVFGQCGAKKWLSKICVKVLRQKRCKLFFVEARFGPFLAHLVLGWVFLQCRTRFGPLITRGKCHFGARGAVPKLPLWRSSVRSPCCAVRFGVEMPLCLRFREVGLGNVATRGRV